MGLPPVGRACVQCTVHLAQYIMMKSNDLRWSWMDSFRPDLLFYQTAEWAHRLGGQHIAWCTPKETNAQRSKHFGLCLFDEKFRILIGPRRRLGDTVVTTNAAGFIIRNKLKSNLPSEIQPGILNELRKMKKRFIRKDARSHFLRFEVFW